MKLKDNTKVTSIFWVLTLIWYFGNTLQSYLTYSSNLLMSQGLSSLYAEEKYTQI